MGFRFKRFDYVGGSAPWNTNVEYDRGAATLTDLANFIISCGKGWSLDTARNATTTSYVVVPLNTYNDTATEWTAPALFFVNTNGAKLFLCASGGSSYCGIRCGNNQLMNDVPFSVSHPIYTGIVMSMIPAGSTNTFGSYFDNSFLPSDATYIYGSALCAANSVQQQNYMCVNSSGVHYSYGLFVDECCVGIGGGYDNSNVPTIKPGYFCGRILGTLAHSTDTSNQARYGIIKFNDSCNKVTTADEFSVAVRSELVSGNYNYGSWCSSAINTNTGYDYLFWSCCGHYFRANGTRIDGRNGSNIRFYPHTCLIAENIKTSDSSVSNANRWVPFEAFVLSNDLSMDGIIPGDGFKGYLDTNLFRCAKVNLNQTYANGTFIGADATNNLLLGWDATNTDSL